MSELKAHRIDNIISAYKIGKAFCMKTEEEVYLKSEADKVIAELEAQKAQAEDDCAYWKMNKGNATNAMHETEEYAMQLYNELRHQKFKRCLAMAYAEWLKQMTLCDYPENILYRRAAKRECKWKEMSQKFKEEK